MASACITKRIQISDRWICYTLERKRVKNLNLRVRPDGTVAVSAPPRFARARSLNFRAVFNTIGFEQARW